jgi:N-acetylglucosamine malate deacetylase 1
MNILAISAHTDDCELGCGGTIAKLVAEGNKVTSLAFSYANEETLKDETKNAMGLLGVENCTILNFEIRNFLKYRQEILQVLYEYDNDNEYDLIFIPARFDMHQDHQVITQEAMRAFKKCTLLGYELPWNNIQFTTNYFVRLQRMDVDKKIAALKCFHSQQEKNYFDGKFLLGLVRVRGVQIKTSYAEAFEAIRVVY